MSALSADLELLSDPVRARILALLGAEELSVGDFVTKAWVDDPLRVVLASIPGYPRTPPPKRRK